MTSITVETAAETIAVEVQDAAGAAEDAATEGKLLLEGGGVDTFVPLMLGVFLNTTITQIESIPSQPARTGGGYLWSEPGVEQFCKSLEPGVYYSSCAVSNQNNSPSTTVILIVNKNNEGVYIFKRWWEHPDAHTYMYVDSNGLEGEEKKWCKRVQNKLMKVGPVVTLKGELPKKFAKNLATWFLDK